MQREDLRAGQHTHCCLETNSTLVSHCPAFQRLVARKEDPGAEDPATFSTQAAANGHKGGETNRCENFAEQTLLK